MTDWGTDVSAFGAFRSGFVTVVGRPNVGKSTLVNRLVGSKVSIVSEKPQTTRHQIRGVMHGDGYQAVFIDTPGIHRPRTLLGERTNESALSAFSHVDVVCMLIDATKPVGPGDRFIAERLDVVKSTKVLVVNKVDAAERDAVMRQLVAGDGLRGDWAEIIPISAQTGTGVPALIDQIVRRLEPGPKYYPDDVVTDQPEAFVAAEIIREQLLAVARDELPHSIVVSIEEIEERPDGSLAMEAIIRVERPSQKGIVIGHHGAVLKAVGIAARAELSALLGTTVHLRTMVRVDRSWQRRNTSLDRLGF